ncbi:MAG: helix-turn-helix domain-containing protein [Marinirhabdus sp.]|nr:helix-turn-helix domain-containing protein [Marinirhabdus sp.]
MEQSPSFDTWTSAFLIAVALGAFLSAVLFTSSTKKSRPIALFILAFTLILFQYVLYWTAYQYEFPYLIMLPPVCYYATGPLLYWYFNCLYTNHKPKALPLHFIPVLLCTVPYLLLLLRNLNLYAGEIYLMKWATPYQPIVVHMSIYSVLLFRMVYRHKNSDSQYAIIRQKWTRTLAVLYALFITAYLSYYVLVNFTFFSDEWDYAISFTMSIAMYTIGFFIFKQPQIFDGEFYASLFLPKTDSATSLEQQILNELFQKIERHMEQQRPYTDNELRLANLADQLGFSTHLLSKVINQQTDDNFNSFVNRYRLEAAEQLLIEDASTPIKTIYFEVGFNSKAAFYSVFKKKHGCTPMQFRKRFKLS